jgi:transcriptional regulator with XRE-family HTH domain
MLRKSASELPEWSQNILAFRKALKLTQGELGKRLNTSAMAVSRWERGDAEPPADAYIRLGNIADDPLCWFFWGRAGLSTADVMRVLPTARAVNRRVASSNLARGANSFNQLASCRTRSFCVQFCAPSP